MWAPAQQTTWSKDFADAIMDRHANINYLTGKGWEYSNSIVLIGIEQLYYETGNTKYLDYIRNYVDGYVNANGDISFDASANNLDHLHPGWLCITLFEETGLEKYKLAADNIRAEFDNQPRNPSGGFWHKERYPNQMWADGIYMASPFLIRYGSVFGDMEYAADEVTHQAILIADHAYDSTKNLMLHGWDETKTASWADTAGLSPEIWSRGMGWYCMALADILDYLPDTHEHYDRLVEIIQGMAIGIKDYQDGTTGLWFQVVDKADSTGNWTESSGSAMFVYMLKKAIDKAYIDSVTYMPVVQKGWEGLLTQITLDSQDRPVINNFVRGMGIQDDYNGYISQERVSTPDSRYPHGYCGILMAASVMEFPLPEFYTLSVTKEGSGQIYYAPRQNDYEPGEEVTITANPAVGWSFSGWSGSFETLDNPLVINMDSSMTFTAVFTEDPPDLAGVTDTDLFSVYPSVAGHEIYLSLPKSLNLGNCVIVNQLGAVVYRSTHHASGAIDVSGFPDGMYRLIFYAGDKLYNVSFVKR